MTPETPGVDLLTGQATDIIDHLPGLRSYTSPRGIRVIELDWWADPSHDINWANSMRRLFATNRDWRREMERDWTTPSGDPFFPEFAEIGREKFILPVTQLIKGPVVRSFDFGRRRPAATWFQFSPRSDRLWLYREFMPHDLGTHDFRDAILHFSGQLDYGRLRDRAKRWVDSYANRPSNAHCPPPWFPLGTRFVDVAGKEALMTQANAYETEDAVAKDIFMAGGINLGIVNPRVEGRHRIVRRLLSLREDGHPGLLIDPQCEEMIEGFEGAFSYAKPTAEGVLKEEMRDDNHYINLADAFGYGVAAVVPPDTPAPTQPRGRLLGWGGDTGREPIYAPGGRDEQIGWKY